MPEFINFNSLVDDIVTQDGLSAIRPVIEKNFCTMIFYFVSHSQGC